MITLETDRLIIRNFRPDDWSDWQAAIVAYQATDAAKFEPPWPTSDDEMKGVVSWFAGGDAYLAICLRPEGTVIGMVAIERRDVPDAHVHNLGYIFHPAYYGKGYATEACRAAMSYVFGEKGADSILTGTHPDNEASVRLLKRLGLELAGNGEYTISRETWLARQ